MKNSEWIGYCDGCKYPYVPYVVADIIEKEKKKKVAKREFIGYCTECYRKLRTASGLPVSAEKMKRK